MSACSDPRVVPIRQFENHVVDGCLTRCSHDFLRIGFRLEARDVFRNGAFKQLDVLRKVTEMLSKTHGIPLANFRAIKPNLAAHPWPGADNSAGKCGLSGAGRPDHPKTGTGFNAKRHIVHNRFVTVGHEGVEIFNFKLAFRFRQRHRLGRRRRLLHKFRQPRPRAAETQIWLPVSDCLLNGRECACHDD